MNPAQEVAVRSCTPDFPTWRIDAKRQLRNRINVCHAVGEPALIRRCAIVQDRRGVTELRRGELPLPGARVGTRTFNLNPDNTVAIVDEWD
ncbi:hypothetical protein LGT39_05860 [Demequina sp. TTPB684]|uniref:hypothetical protein n=1 Tax=unclassified Demequina TaxID=2620311 RepID=UPI001CF1845D|nr:MULTISPECIES: hypothetical protein [unclassified Demequina]MCB2412373.1 hypothetical protein [Demequina sp. TTPB684]UPU89043.1 hypothetical protein LGT36_003715 [Demequina sp. TMPB413]